MLVLDSSAPSILLLPHQQVPDQSVDRVCTRDTQINQSGSRIVVHNASPRYQTVLKKAGRKPGRSGTLPVISQGVTNQVGDWVR